MEEKNENVFARTFLINTIHDVFEDCLKKNGGRQTRKDAIAEDF